MSMNTVPRNTVRIAELKANLSAFLREVRRGHALTVLDRETPVARLLPYADHDVLIVRRPTLSAKDIRLPKAPRRRTNSLKILLEDRQSGR